jgi:internalin A
MQVIRPFPHGSVLADNAGLVDSPAMKNRMTEYLDRFRGAALLTAIALTACGDEESPVATATSPEPPAVAATPPASTFWSEVTLHEAIRSANPGYTGNGQFQIDQRGQPQAISLDDCGITDFSPLRGMSLMALSARSSQVPDIEALRGMPLVELYLENTGVKDLSPLSGMSSLRKLYLSGTPVTDLGPLRGLSLVEMNLVETPVSDLGPLAGAPLQMLWLTDTQVEDLTPLAKCPLVSLTVHRTAVSDLSPLAGTRLQRLHIGGTRVTDLTPLEGVPLTRLVFDASQIQKGLEVVKRMPTLQEIGSQFEDGANNLKPPGVYWAE